MFVSFSSNWYLIKLVFVGIWSNWLCWRLFQIGICWHFNLLISVQFNIYRFLFKSWAWPAQIHPSWCSLAFDQIGIRQKFELIFVHRFFLQIDNREVGRLTSIPLSRINWYLLKFDKSNVAEAWFFWGLSMVLLLKSDCTISIFSGLGGHQLSFFSVGQKIAKIALTMSFFMLFSPITTPPFQIGIC